MLHRLAAFAIVIFWFVMTLLLIRNEISPDASRVREVPITHVLKMLYLHEQPSDLTIYNGPTSIGSVRLHPRIDRDGETRVLDFSGELQLKLSPEQRTRLSWLGLLDMTPTYDIKRSKWTFTVLDPGYLRAEIETPAGSKTTHFALRTRDRVIDEGEIPTDQGALSGIARQMNLGPNLDALVKQGGSQTPPVIHARQSSLRWRGEKTDTFLITIEQNGQTLIEAHISQLGQVLHATTILGYMLRSSDLNL